VSADDSAQWSQPFGKYWLDAELARGGMSRVYRAHLRGPGGFEKHLLVKQILPQLAQDPGFIDLFVREANTLVRMSHPNIVPIYELGVIDGTYFLSMELVEGATVAELLGDGPLPEALCAQIGLQVSEALRYAQERFSLAHRDVTPRNVIVDADGHVRLLDFGIAAPLGHGGRGEVFGSEGYMSPEQRRGAPLDSSSDLFSLGAVLYEALTGARALSAGRDVPPEPATAHEPQSTLAPIVDELLAQSPTARPASAALVATRLRTWLAQHHPEGVSQALGERVERARARIASKASPSQPPPASASQTPGLTRSLATSPQLEHLLSEGTERLARSEPGAPASARERALPWLAGALLLAAGLGSLFWLDAQAPRAEPASAAVKARLGPEPDSVGPAASTKKAAATTSTTATTNTSASTNSGSSTSAAAGTPQGPAQGTAGRAVLSVNALPWADAKLDGRALGKTPWRARPASPGSHVLALDCPALGRSARVPLELSAGKHTQVLVDLRSEPPLITVK
jgi:serine/threonine-protein kinase